MIIQSLTDKAKAGDIGAARLLLERVIPPLRAVEAPQALQIDGGDLSGQAKSVVALAASGEVSVTQACWRRSNIDHLCRLNIDQGT